MSAPIFVLVDDKHIPVYRIMWVSDVPHFCGNDECQCEGEVLRNSLVNFSPENQTLRVPRQVVRAKPNFARHTATAVESL